MMIRGMEGKPTFQDNQERKDFVNRLRELAKKTGTRIPAWSLLGNHVHEFESRVWDCDGGDSEEVRGLDLAYHLGCSKEEGRTKSVKFPKSLIPQSMRKAW